jgi:hypothetical protein
MRPQNMLKRNLSINTQQLISVYHTVTGDSQSVEQSGHTYLRTNTWLLKFPSAGVIRQSANGVGFVVVSPPIFYTHIFLPEAVSLLHHILLDQIFTFSFCSYAGNS